jgi:hypothetical protein
MRELVSSRSIVSNTPVKTNTRPDKQPGFPCESKHESVNNHDYHSEHCPLSLFTTQCSGNWVFPSSREKYSHSAKPVRKSQSWSLDTEEMSKQSTHFHSKGSWWWCIIHGITEFLDSVHLLAFQTKKNVSETQCFQSQVKGWEAVKSVINRQSELLGVIQWV